MSTSFITHENEFTSAAVATRFHIYMGRPVVAAVKRPAFVAVAPLPLYVVTYTPVPERDIERIPEFGFVIVLVYRDVTGGAASTYAENEFNEVVNIG